MAVIATSLYFIHQQIGISWGEVVAYIKAVPLLFFYWIISGYHIPFLSDALQLSRALGLDNVPRMIRDWEAYNIAMSAVLAFICLLPVTMPLGLYVVVSWLVRLARRSSR